MGVELQLVGGGEAAAPHSSQPFPLPGWLSQLPTRSSLRAPVQMLIALFFACLFATSGDVRRVPTLLPTARFLPTDCLRLGRCVFSKAFFGKGLWAAITVALALEPTVGGTVSREPFRRRFTASQGELG